MKRVVQPELLDALPPDDPRAVRSRRDLRRINRWMRNPAIMARALQAGANGHAPERIVDLGGGDGDLLLGVARRLAPSWRHVSATLLDRQVIVAPQTSAAFARLGWRAEAEGRDVFAWAKTVATRPVEAVTANLFLHHFSETQLAELFHRMENSVRLFVAVEPRRGGWPLFCSRLLWAIGCNAVTQYDAMVSVRAGFTGRELGALWPAGKGWQLTERPAGVFSHLFVAQRTG